MELRKQNNPFCEEDEQGVDVVMHYPPTPYGPEEVIVGTIEQAFPVGWWCSMRNKRSILCSSIDQASQYAINILATE